MTKTIQHQFTIPEELAGMRLDQALTKLLPDYSRTQIQLWLESGEIKLNELNVKARTLVIGGEQVTVSASLKPQTAWEAQAIPLDVVHEDDDVLVINKPVGMVVHPAAGNANNTLLNALLHHCPALKEMPRAGILHRLDKDTTGLLIIAKTPAALKNLSRQLKNRTITRIYRAIIAGVLVSGGTIDEPIARHPLNRKKMTVTETGKPSVTHYRVIERYRAYTQVKVQLETGRTHQIRVHMAHAHHPILGDPVYGGRLQLPKGASAPLVDMLRKFKRQALHAVELKFTHPTTKKTIQCHAPVPDDMQALIDVLKADVTHDD